MAEALAATAPCPVEFVGVKDTSRRLGRAGRTGLCLRDCRTLHRAAATQSAEAQEMSRFSASGKRTRSSPAVPAGLAQQSRWGLGEAGADVPLNLSREAGRGRRHCAAARTDAPPRHRPVPMDVTSRVSVVHAAEQARAFEPDFDPGQQCRGQQADRFRPDCGRRLADFVVDTNLKVPFIVAQTLPAAAEGGQRWRASPISARFQASTGGPAPLVMPLEGGLISLAQVIAGSAPSIISAPAIPWAPV